MKNVLFLIATAIVIGSTAGCNMCCGPFDYDYPTFGGKHMRADRAYGRVGSPFSDPMAFAAGPGADSNLAAPAEPLSDLDDDDGDSLLDDGPTGDEGNRNDSGIDSELRKLDEELEGIEPLRDQTSANSENSTASSRWRPRPLRGQRQIR